MWNSHSQKKKMVSQYVLESKEYSSFLGQENCGSGPNCAPRQHWGSPSDKTHTQSTLLNFLHSRNKNVTR